MSRNMPDTMFDSAGLLDNYHHPRHFLQLVHLPAVATPRRPFVYVKNHKCACTTVLATLMAHLQAQQAGHDTHDLDMGTIHTPPKSLLRTGRRGLTTRRAMRAIADDTNFRFTVVRDPVARTVSAFADKVAGAERPGRQLMKYLGRPEDGDITLSQFLDIVAQDEGARDLDRHWREQRKEISYDFIPYDYVGDTATLGAALGHVTRTVFAQEPRFQDTRRSLGHKSASHELLAAMTPTDRANIEKAYAADFEMYEDIRKRHA